MVGPTPRLSCEARLNDAETIVEAHLQVTRASSAPTACSTAHSPWYCRPYYSNGPLRALQIPEFLLSAARLSKIRHAVTRRWPPAPKSPSLWVSLQLALKAAGASSLLVRASTWARRPCASEPSGPFPMEKEAFIRPGVRRTLRISCEARLNDAGPRSGPTYKMMPRFVCCIRLFYGPFPPVLPSRTTTTAHSEHPRAVESPFQAEAPPTPPMTATQ
jgi:hypothetical protein